MSPARWQQVKQIFAAAQSLSSDEHEQFLNEACAGDASLRGKVETLLASYSNAESFMEQPATKEVAKMIAEDENKLTRGQQFAHYKIIEPVGAGGMGEVYLAEDVNLERRVAIKFLPACDASDAQANKRLVREARTVATLDHPHICAVYEVGESGGRAFIVMQFVEGETLAVRIGRGKLSVNEAVELAAQIADALAEAHRAGVIHRDIKPSNIMLNARGQVKVLDFGLAKFVEQPTLDSAAQTASLLSVPGALMGTMPYMSPEQMRGEMLDERTDVFSFGVVVYEMLSGRQPFMHASGAEIISAILTHEPAPLAAFSPHSPPELQQIVERCLAKDKERRYQTMREAADDLRALQRRETNSHAQISSAPTVITKKQTNNGREIRWRPAPMLAVLSLLLLAAIGFSVYRRYVVQPLEAIESIAVLPLANSSGDQNLEYLSDGITESLINNLSQLPNLKVMSRNSVFRFKGKDADAQAAAQKLGVRAVMTGNVKQIDNQLMINVELIDANDGSLILSRQYIRKESDVIAMQANIAQDVVSNLRVKLSGAEQKQLAKQPTANPEAYQLYLRGRFYANRDTPDGLHEAIKYYQQAVERDPNYALAFANMSQAYIELGLYYESAKESMPRAKAYAMKALQIDSTLVDAHVNLGLVSLVYDWDWATAEREMSVSSGLNPKAIETFSCSTHLLESTGHGREGEQEIRKALAIDPLSVPLNTELGCNSYYQRQYDRAIREYRESLELDSRNPIAYWGLGQAFGQKKMYKEAIDELKKVEAINGSAPPIIIAEMGYAYAAWGKKDEARKIIQKLNEIGKQTYVDPYLIAGIYSALYAAHTKIPTPG